MTLKAEDSALDHCVRRQFEVLDSVSQTKVTLLHIHFTSWVDWQLPSYASRASLAVLVELAADFVAQNKAKS